MNAKEAREITEHALLNGEAVKTELAKCLTIIRSAAEKGLSVAYLPIKENSLNHLQRKSVTDQLAALGYKIEHHPADQRDHTSVDSFTACW